VSQPRPGLVRAIGRWDLVALTINAIIGAGIFGLPSTVFARVGVYSLLAFVVCGLAVTLIILCFAEVSSRFTATGGPYLYAREAFGPLVGFEVGWMMWIARLTAFAANCNLLVSYFALFVPAAETDLWRAVTITAIVAALTVVNLVGVRDTAVLSNVLAISKLVPLSLLVVAGCFFLDSSRFVAAQPLRLDDFSVSVLLLVYAFTGFEMSVIPGAELRDPARDLPRALVTAMAIVFVFYVLIQVVAIGTLPSLATSARPLSDAAGAFLGPIGAGVIAAGAVVSVLGNLNVSLLVAPRLPFAMAERGELPRAVAATHSRFRTPHVAILLTAALVLTLTLSGTFVYAATISVIARLVAYVTTVAALPVFRLRAGPAPFSAPAGTVLAVISLAVVAWLLTSVTARQARDAAIAALAGLVLYGLVRVYRGHQQETTP
jgi:amino acid transporter